MEPSWIDSELIMAIHARQLAEHGGGTGVRDTSLLESALARPLRLYAYGDPPPDLAALAASLAAGIAKNHPFVDGNKRTAYVAMRTFLVINGVDIAASQEDKYEVMLGLAAGEVTEEGLARWIRDHLAPGDDDSVHEPTASYG